MTPTVAVRHACVLRDGLEFTRGDVVAVVTRTGSDEETTAVIAESLRDESALTGDAWFELLGPGADPGVRPAVTIVTARGNDPELHELLGLTIGACTAARANLALAAMAAADPSLHGVCGRCQRTVDNTDPDHRVTPIVRGGHGVECRLRGDYE